MAHGDVPWWKRTTVYQIYPRSFADANGDGIGDLMGIVERLDYLHALGVETLWISPFFQSPQADFGYDISDHFGVAPEYGSLDDVRRLVDETHARGMKIVFDMVLNHTSEHHPWFLESRRSRTNPRRDWYLWREGRKPGGAAPPNNWKSMLGGRGWHYDEASGEWYWASFLPFQPDLNYRNPEVKSAMLGVVRHWLAQGVDGLRLDIFNAIYKDASFDDNPFSLRPVPSEDNPHGFFQRYHHTLDHPDTLAFARELRAVADEFTAPPRFLVGEVFGDAEMLRRYCGEDADGLHMVFLFKAMKTRFAGRAVRSLIEEFERAFPEPFTPTYVFGNHDRPRFIHRLGECQHKAKLLATMQLTVRGVPFIYYGEEIGMEHHEIPLHEGRDPIASRFRFMPQWLARGLKRFGILLNRDECRLPMQWHHGPNAGFSPGHAEPWLPVHPKAGENNVAAQERDPESLLNCYRNLLALRRRSDALAAGKLEMHDAARLPREVVGYRRVHGEGAAQEAVDVFLNFGDSPVQLDLRGHEGRTVVSNRRGEASAAAADHPLGPYEGVLVLDAGAA
jgi:oligo-1,6-glucosidase/alpha-glucosidase